MSILKKVLLAGVLLLLGGFAEAAVKTQTVTYTHDGTTRKGHLPVTTYPVSSPAVRR